jgi:hypothetical protein
MCGRVSGCMRCARVHNTHTPTHTPLARGVTSVGVAALHAHVAHLKHFVGQRLAFVGSGVGLFISK